MITCGSPSFLRLKSTLPNQVELPLQLVTTIRQDPGSPLGNWEPCCCTSLLHTQKGLVSVNCGPLGVTGNGAVE